MQAQSTRIVGQRRRARWSVQLFLAAMAFLWLVPLLWAFWMALRPYGETILNGYISWPSTLNLANFVTFWNEAEVPQFYFNTLIVTIPAVILTLWVASMLAFAVTRFSWRFNLLVLMLFTAGNLLPPQVIIVPLFRIYLAIHIPWPLSDNGLLFDQFVGLILIHVVFQTGFATFVLSNYMKTLSKELTEAALVDGAGVWTMYSRVILPLCRPALGAMATLLFTFIYNDFFWAVMLLQNGNKRPITAAINNWQGSFFSDPNALVAGGLLAAIPTVLVFIALQNQFKSGLTLGSTKG